MTLIEVDDGIFINLENIFKFQIKNLGSSERCYIRFFRNDTSYANSKEFETNDSAKEWIFMKALQAGGTNEIIS